MCWFGIVEVGIGYGFVGCFGVVGVEEYFNWGWYLGVVKFYFVGDFFDDVVGVGECWVLYYFEYLLCLLVVWY